MAVILTGRHACDRLIEQSPVLMGEDYAAAASWVIQRKVSFKKSKTIMVIHSYNSFNLNSVCSFQKTFLTIILCSSQCSWGAEDRTCSIWNHLTSGVLLRSGTRTRTYPSGLLCAVRYYTISGTCLCLCVCVCVCVCVCDTLSLSPCFLRMDYCCHLQQREWL